MFGLFATPTTGGAIWTAVAFALAGGTFWLGRRTGPVLVSAWVAIAVFVAGGLLPVIGYVRTFTPYHVHVIVLGPPGASLENAQVWSSVQTEPKKVAGGWQLDIPASALPPDRNVMFWASLVPNDTRHSKAVRLIDDHEPTVTIRTTGTGSHVEGRVVDRSGAGIRDAMVSLAGHGERSVRTEDGGTFLLNIDAEEGEQTLLQVAAFGKLTVAWAAAGDTSLRIIVDSN